MTQLEECLYQHIDEQLYGLLMQNGEYLLACKLRDDAETRLTARLNKRQKKLLNRYLDEENRLLSIQNRQLFCETLTAVRSLFHVSL